MANIIKNKNEDSRFNGRKEVKNEVLDYLNRLLNTYKQVARAQNVEIPLRLIKGIINDVKKINERPIPPVQPPKEEEDLAF